jgi:hypothetical protein
LKSDDDSSGESWEIDFVEVKKRLTQNELPLSKRRLDKKPNKEFVDAEAMEEPWYFVHV